MHAGDVDGCVAGRGETSRGKQQISVEKLAFHLAHTVPDQSERPPIIRHQRLVGGGILSALS